MADAGPTTRVEPSRVERDTKKKLPKPRPNFCLLPARWKMNQNSRNELIACLLACNGSSTFHSLLASCKPATKFANMPSIYTAASIPPMCFTDSGCAFACPRTTLQFFKVEIEEVTGGLQWPIGVYGIVAVRDVLDHNRNIIFYRERDSCQTITSTDPYLALTGPTRAVVVTVHPTYFEVDLKVKGAVESEDTDLSFLAVSYISQGSTTSCLLDRVATSKLSTVSFTFGQIVNPVEATVIVEVLGGKWSHGYHKGVFTAKTASIKGMAITLLAFEDGKLPIDDDGQVKLSRRVVCVELVPPENNMKAKLMVTLKALHINDKKGKVEHRMSFKPKKKGRCHRTIKVDSCEMRVTVAWSLLSTFKCSCYDKAISAARAV